MSEPIIELKNISKRYQIGKGRSVPKREFFWALKDVSFNVEQGEIVGVIGRNGAGKSTLLKILSQITEPTEGRAVLRGRTSSLLEVGTGFHPELSGRENIYLNGAILGMRKKEIDRKFDEIVSFAETEKFLDTPVKRYSSGMYVRLAFSIAAHLEPEILLVDEVLAMGDANFQKKCLGKMNEAVKEGRTILFVSHSMPSVANLCTRVLLLDKGKVIQDGPPSRVIERYLQNSGSQSGQISWPDDNVAPQNENVILRGMRLLQDGLEEPTADIDISRELVIEMTYENLNPGALLYTALLLKDALGAPVLSSSNFKSVSLTEDPWNGRPHEVGIFKSQCRIPANFLNDTSYHVSAFIGKFPVITLIQEEDVLSFKVHDTGQMRKEFYGGWAGVVRPRLAWHTDYLGAAQTSAAGV